MAAADDVNRLRESAGTEGWESGEFRGEHTLRVPVEALHQVLAQCRNQLGYAMLLDISGVDHLGEIRALKWFMNWPPWMIPNTCG